MVPVTLEKQTESKTLPPAALMLLAAGCGLLFRSQHEALVLIVKILVYLLAAGGFILLPVKLRLSSASFLIVFFFAELGLWAHDVYLSLKYPRDSNPYGFWQHDPLTGWRQRADFEKYYVSKADRFRTLVRTNSKGLRDEEYPYDKPPGVTRILLLGDSVTVGMEVDKKGVLDSRLEEKLSGRGNYEVVNAGISAYGTDQSLLFLIREGYKYSPDVIVYGAVSNDFTENISIHQRPRFFGKSYFKLEENGELTLKGTPVPHFRSDDPWVMSLPEAEVYYNERGKDENVKGETKGGKAATYAVTRSIKQDLSRTHFYRWLRHRAAQDSTLVSILTRLGLKEPESEPLPKPEAVYQSEFRTTRALFNEMKNFAASLGVKFLVYEFANGVGPAPARPTDFERICRELGIPYLNLSDGFHRISKGRRVFCFPHDGHWNVRGHELAAEFIYQELLQKGWVGSS